MSTGLVDLWHGNDLAQFGPIYPFVGSEVFWFILCVAFWLIWHVLQARAENRAYEQIKQEMSPEHLKWALRQDTLHGAVSSDDRNGSFQ